MCTENENKGHAKQVQREAGTLHTNFGHEEGCRGHRLGKSLEFIFLLAVGILLVELDENGL